MKVTISKAGYLAALALVQAKQDVRYYLNGIKIEAAKTGCNLIATDGHRMLVIHDAEAVYDRSDDSQPDSVVVALGRTALAQIKKVAALDSPVTLNFKERDNGTQFDIVVEVGAALITDESETIDGRYPEWRRTLPEVSKPGRLPFFNPAYLADFAKIDSLVNRGAKYASMTITAQRCKDFGAMPTTPALVQFTGSPHVVGVLMPIRVEDAEQPSASWLSVA